MTAKADPNHRLRREPGAAPLNFSNSSRFCLYICQSGRVSEIYTALTIWPVENKLINKSPCTRLRNSGFINLKKEYETNRKLICFRAHPSKFGLVTQEQWPGTDWNPNLTIAWPFVRNILLFRSDTCYESWKHTYRCHERSVTLISDKFQLTSSNQNMNIPRLQMIN